MTALIYVSFVLTFLYVILLIFGVVGLSGLLHTTTGDMPRISVIIPAHNSEETLPEVIKSLKNQTYPESLREIIFINDRSCDNTNKILNKAVSSLKNSYLINVKDIEKGISPKKNALLKGINKASHNIILTTDSDTILPRRWIEIMAGSFKKNISMVLGYSPYRTDNEYDTLFHKMLALEYFSLGAVAAGSSGLGIPLTSSGANLAFRKDTFFNIGGYGETIKILSGDDDLLLHRFRKFSNGKIVFNPSKESSVKNNPPANLKSFIRQRIRFSSKHFAYPFSAKLIMGTVYLFHLLLLLLLILTPFFFSRLLPLAAMILALKSVTEVIFLKKAQHILEYRNLIKYYLPAFIPHLLYVVFIPVFAQILPERW